MRTPRRSSCGRNKAIRLLILGVVLTSSFESLQSQLLPFRHYTRENGLIANDVTTLFQDSLKFLWIGTANGITRFDGTEFSSYTTADGLPSNYISAVEESQGWLWVATFDGLARTRANSAGTDRSFSKFLAGPLSGARKIFALLGDPGGSLLCATDAGLFRVWGDSLAEILHHGEKIHAHSLARQTDGSVWLNNNSELLVLDLIRSETRRLSTPQIGSLVSIAADDHGNVWVATRDSTIHRFRNEVQVSRRRLRSAIRNIRPDNAGNILCSSSDGLLSIPADRFDDGEFLRYGQAQGLLSSNVEFSLIDHEYGLWIAQRERGVSLLTERGLWIFPLTGIPETTNNGRAATDRHGHFWAVNVSGIDEIWRTPHGSWTRYTHALRREWSRGAMISLRMSPAGTLWVHTRSRIYEFRIDQRNDGASSLHIIRSLSTALDARRSTAMFILVASDETIWLSYTGLGVAQIDPTGRRRTRTFTERDGLPSDDVRVLFEDRAGTIWFGGYASGIALLPRGSSRIVPLSESSHLEPGQRLPDDMIRTIEEDRQGRMWIGTRYQGIAVIEHGRVRSIGTDNGLINNSVWAFAEEPDSSMWVATALGLQQVSFSTMESVPARESLVGRPVASLGMGLNGYAWYTTPEAFRVFTHGPGRRPASPPVYITRMTANTVAVDTDGAIELRADQNNVELAFSGVSFVPARGLTFQHRLLGADDRWRNATNARSTLFLALEPGSYSFEVRAATPTLEDPRSAARVRFTVLQPFWRRWWFVTGSFFGLIVIGYLLVRLRERRLRAIEQLRSRISRDLHDEIGSNLTGIAMSSQLILQKKGLGKDERSRLSEIRHTAQRTSELMRDIVWLINPGNDSLDELLLWMKTTAFSLLGPIEHTFSSPTGEHHAAIDLTVKRSLFLIYKEALTNVAKHSHATLVGITVRFDGDAVSIRIEDNGIGLGSKGPGRGNGLRNMRSRAEEIGGSFAVEAGTNGGTVVSIRARITQMRNGLSG